MNETLTSKIWAEFFELQRTVDVTDDFMAERPLNVVTPGRGLFDDDALH